MTGKTTGGITIGQAAARMTRFAVPLPLPGLAWDLLTDLEPILLTATEPRSHMVEVLDHAGAFESEDIESARTESARREHPAHRITLTIRGYAGPASAPQQRRQYTVSVWASGLAKTWGATVNGHATGGGAAAASYAESLLGELGGQVRAFLQHHHIPAGLIGQDPDQPEPPAARAQAEGEAMSTLTPNELTYPLIPAAIEGGAPRPRDALAAPGVMLAGVRR